MATATARSLAGLMHDLTNEELFVLTESANRAALKAFLSARIAKMWRQISYDPTVGIVRLIERAVGPACLGNISVNITEERFPLKGTRVRSVKCRIEAGLDHETRENAAKRLTDAGHVLASIGDLAGFLHDHPDEMAKFGGWVLALSEDSRYTKESVGFVYVPCAANVGGADRYFSMCDFNDELTSLWGVLVLG